MRIYAILEEDSTFYPHMNFVNKENGTTSWAWTVAQSISYSKDEEGTIIQSINEIMADTEHYILTSTMLNIVQQTGQELGNIFAPVSILPIKPTNDGENTTLAIDNSEILTFAFSVNTIYQTSFNSIPFIEI